MSCNSSPLSVALVVSMARPRPGGALERDHIFIPVLSSGLKSDDFFVAFFWNRSDDAFLSEKFQLIRLIIWFYIFLENTNESCVSERCLLRQGRSIEEKHHED